MKTNIDTQNNIATSLQFWKKHDFYAPDTVVLGLDIGIEGIGIAVRKGQELVYCKTLLINLPSSKPLAKRRAFRAARHARKNRKTRMRRLKSLFELHGLPWVNDDVMSRTDPFKLRYRAINGKLSSKEALSICIRSCVLRRGYDYSALNEDSINGEYPWGEELSLNDAKKWINSAYIDSDMKKFLNEIGIELTDDPKKLEEWNALVEYRYALAESCGIPAMLHAYYKGNLNERKARGYNYPREHVKAHLNTIIDRHRNLIADADKFIETLFWPCETWQDKQISIFHYNRKTPKEAKRIFNKKIKNCLYCSWLNLPIKKCCEKANKDFRKWTLIDFVSVRTFELQHKMGLPFRTKLPADGIKSLIEAIENNYTKWEDAKKQLVKALKSLGLSLTKNSELNNLQITQLKDIVTPTLAIRKKRAAMSSEAARKMYLESTHNETDFEADNIEQWKKNVQLYDFRKNLPHESGCYPQVEILLGARKTTVQELDSGSYTVIDKLISKGKLQTIFEKKLKHLLGGKLVPDYCIIETIRHAPKNSDEIAEITNQQEKNHQLKLKAAETYERKNASRSDFLRIRLFEEQGGSANTPAKCPFTGQNIFPKDIFSSELELAHIYPDSKGGLYMAENLVLTTRKVNQQMHDYTPIEAAHAHLDGWLDWEHIIENIEKFNWSEKKYNHFTHDYINKPQFPDFNNLTRVAQLARELRQSVICWLGINGDDEQIRQRIGNPMGLYTASARYCWLGPNQKDRSNHLHHRMDAAVISCLPPQGLNDVRYKGIFYTEKTPEKNRRLVCLNELPLPDFKKTEQDSSECPIIKQVNRSKYIAIGDSTFWSCDKKTGQTNQRIPLIIDKKISATDLFVTLKKMGIAENLIPSEKEIQRWIIKNQPATINDTIAYTHLKLKNGTPVKSIWKFGKNNGTLCNTPAGWSGSISEKGKFRQLKKLSEVNSSIEIWLAKPSPNKPWKYYKKLILSPESIRGLQKMKLPMDQCDNYPDYLNELLIRSKKKSLRELIFGNIPKNAIKVGTIKKGDKFIYTFERSAVDIETEQRLNKYKNITINTLPVTTWGIISSINSVPSAKIKSLTHKGMKDKVITDAKKLAELLGLNPNATIEAINRRLEKS